MPLSNPRLICSIFLISLISLISGCAGEPPTEQMALTKTAIENAMSEGGTEFAPVEMRHAQEKLELAREAMDKKDYELARWVAEEAEADAELAAAKVRSAKAQQGVAAVQENIHILKQELDRQDTSQ